MKLKPENAHRYGKTLRSSQVAGLRIAETAYMPGLKVPPHSHEHAYFCLVIKGTFDGLYGKGRQAGKPFAAVFRPPNELHSVNFHDEGALLFSLEVENRWLERAREHGLILDRSTELTGGALSWLAIRLYREACSMDEASPLVIEGLFLEMLAEASRRAAQVTERRPPAWLVEAREIIHTRFKDSLTIGQLAEAVGVHPVHLATVFRKFYRCTIGEDIRRLRIEYACRHVSGSNMSLVEIALAAGFSDQSHFSKTFKQFTGMSPVQFRSSFRSS